MRAFAQEELLGVAREIVKTLGKYIDTSDNTNLAKLIEYVQARFESKFGVKNAVLTRSGSEAFYGSLIALGIQRGDEIILPVSICQCVVNMVIFTGAIPVFADVDENLALSQKNITDILSDKTKAIVYFHPFGMTGELKWLREIVQKNRKPIYIIEDCAQAAGAYLGESIPVGNQGDISIFSFGRAKPVSAGTGGMVCTPDEQLFHKIKHTCRSGALGFSDYDIPGINSTVSILDALLILYKIEEFEKDLATKLKKAYLYKELLGRYGRIIGDIPDFDGRKNIFHRFILDLDTCNCKKKYDAISLNVIRQLEELGIYSAQTTIPTPPFGVGFVQDYYKKMGRADLYDSESEKFRVWKSLENRYLYFKTHEGISFDDIRKTCAIFSKVFEEEVSNRFKGG